MANCSLILHFCFHNPTDITTFRNDITKDEGKAFNETVRSLHIRYDSFEDLPFMIGCK